MESGKKKKGGKKWVGKDMLKRSVFDLGSYWMSFEGSGDWKDAEEERLNAKLEQTTSNSSRNGRESQDEERMGATRGRPRCVYLDDSQNDSSCRRKVGFEDKGGSLIHRERKKEEGLGGGGEIVAEGD